MPSLAETAAAMPTQPTILRDYERVENAIRYLERRRPAQPTLGQIARHVGLSQSHLQKLFSRWAGISPKRFLQYLTLAHTKRLLRDAASTLETAHDAGLSSVSRLHELFVECESMTPGEYKGLGAGLPIHFGFHSTPFGEMLAATTSRGLCALLFVDASGRRGGIAHLRKTWPRADLREDASITSNVVRRIFKPDRDLRRPLYMLVKGTNFQIKVWEALLRIPPGRLVSYGDLARHLDAPRAARAVANAVARNPIHFLIPCHRVIRDVGEFGGYRGGGARKKAIHVWESAKTRAEV